MCSVSCGLKVQYQAESEEGERHIEEEQYLFVCMSVSP